ncbi:methyltransferase domain-containing protein [Candidatus Peregrinibacteria bacterium]|nr:methyltransferase domain-containing protein [Candidatus Peregrinibacteria bacterium]
MKKKFTQKITEKIKASYSQFASEFDQTRRQQWPEFDHFLAYTRKHAKVLDLGCGTGRLYEFLQPKEVTYLGVDHNSHLLELARKNFPEAAFRLDDITDLKLEEEAFDNIFCIAAFHHIPTKKMRRKVLKDLEKILKPDGILILTVWNLFQYKYGGALLKGIFRCLLTLGFKGAWNDLFIKWGDYPVKRYYHAFLPLELLALFSEKSWSIEDFYFTRKGKRVRWFRSFNFVLIARKK